jgi:hypothetical protein
MMAKFESELGPAITRIDTAGSIDNVRDRSILLEFICLLLIRNPRLRETVNDFQDQIVKRILYLMTETPDRWAHLNMSKIVLGQQVSNGFRMLCLSVKPYHRSDQRGACKWPCVIGCTL